MVTPDIEQTESERGLLAQIEFDWDRQTPEDYEKTAKRQPR